MGQFIPTAHCIEQNEQSIKLSARIDADLLAFEGHFPEFAVFPGVAQIAMVKQIIAEHFAELGQISRIEQLRFQNFILPEQDIFIFIEKNEEHVTFKLTNAVQETVASGRLLFKDNHQE